MPKAYLHSDPNGTDVQLMKLGASQAVVTGAVSAQSTALTTDVVMLTASAACFVAFGANPTATSSSHYLIADYPYVFAVTEGHKIAALQVAAAGVLYVSEFA